jgi:hypothetical protein
MGDNNVRPPTKLAEVRRSGEGLTTPIVLIHKSLMTRRFGWDCHGTNWKDYEGLGIHGRGDYREVVIRLRTTCLPETIITELLHQINLIKDAIEFNNPHKLDKDW